MYNVTFYLRRLHSIAGLVCLGGFLLEHILTNARVLISPASFNSAVDLLASIPWFIMLPLEIGLVAAPFLFHTPGLLFDSDGDEGRGNRHVAGYVPNLVDVLDLAAPVPE